MLLNQNQRRFFPFLTLPKRPNILLGLCRSGVDTAWFVHVTMVARPGCILFESSVATVRLTGCIETWLLPKLSPSVRLQKQFNLATSRIEPDDWESKNLRNVGNYLPVDDSSQTRNLTLYAYVALLYTTTRKV
jgi:hypothetical protein